MGRRFQDTIAQHGIEKFAKKLLGESEIEAVLQRLDRLTREEGRMTVAQTLEVIHGLVNNVKIVMNGTQFPTNAQLNCYCFGNRRQSINGRHPKGSGYALSYLQKGGARADHNGDD